MKHERASTKSAESGRGSQRLGLWGPASPVSSGGEGRRCGKLLREFEKDLLRIDGLETGFFDMGRGEFGGRDGGENREDRKEAQCF